MKFAWISVEEANYPVTVLCRVLGVSSSGYYAWLSRPDSQRAIDDRRLAVLIREAFEVGRGNYGSPRVHRELLAQGVCVSRKRVIRIMQQLGLVGRMKKKFVRTTNSNHKNTVADNLLAQNFNASQPNAVWAGDVTFLKIPQGWLYLAVLLDLHSRAVVGWALSTTNDRHLALKALDMAVKRRRPSKGLLHHTDRGSPYASHDYRKELRHHGMVCSMSGKGNCYDNAVVESWFGTFKTELGEEFDSQEEARRLIFDHIEVFYNKLRRHSKLDYLSPLDFEQREAA